MTGFFGPRPTNPPPDKGGLTTPPQGGAASANPPQTVYTPPSKNSKEWLDMSRLVQKDPRFLRLIADLKIRGTQSGVDAKILESEGSKALRDLQDQLTLEYLELRYKYEFTNDLVEHKPGVDVVMLAEDLKRFGLSVPKEYLTITDILKGLKARPRSLPAYIQQLG